MGYSHERGAAVRSILRARAIGDQTVVDDAEAAASGYLDAEDFDEHAGHHAPGGLPDDDPVKALLAERDRYRLAAIKTETEVHDILAKALGYPEYQPGEPCFSTDKTSHVTGDHVAASLAHEAAARIAELERIVEDAGL